MKGYHQINDSDRSLNQVDTEMSKSSFPEKKIIFDKKGSIISGFSESFFIEIELEYY